MGSTVAQDSFDTMIGEKRRIGRRAYLPNSTEQVYIISESYVYIKSALQVGSSLDLYGFFHGRGSPKSRNR